jgi:hypothetical protein
MMVAPGQKGSARGRADPGGVKAVVAYAFIGQPLDIGRAGQAAEAELAANPRRRSG